MSESAVLFSEWEGGRPGESDEKHAQSTQSPLSFFFRDLEDKMRTRAESQVAYDYQAVV